MKARTEQSSDARLGNAVRVFSNGDRAAILLLRTGQDGIYDSLRAAFERHQAPLADLAEGLPEVPRSAGDCLIRHDGARVTVEGAGGFVNGSALMGFAMESNWGPTAPSFITVARSEGCVWLGLLTEEDYTNAFFGPETSSQKVPRIPVMPVLKLDALFEEGLV